MNRSKQLSIDLARPKSLFRRVGLFTWLILSATYPLQAQQQGPVPVAAATVTQQSIARGKLFVGSIVPLRESTVGSTVEDRLEALLVQEGARVSAGQPLAKLRSRSLELQIVAAEAQLEALEQQLAELENGSRPEEIERGEAELAQSIALRSYAISRRRRVEELVRKRAESSEVLDEAVSNAEAAEEAVRSSEAALKLLKAGPRAEQIAIAKANVEAQQGRVDLLRDQLNQHTILSPFDGYVTVEHTEVGQWVGRGDPVVGLVELVQVDVEVKVPEDDIRFISPGTSARVDVAALPDRSLNGEVALVVPRADLRSRTFPVKVRVQNEETAGNPLLKAGMIARVTLPVGREHTALLVPKDALVLGGPSPLVFVIDPESASRLGTVRPVAVVPGVAEGDLIEVDGELKNGELVVVQGNERLRPGQQVEIIRTITTANRTRTANSGS